MSQHRALRVVVACAAFAGARGLGLGCSRLAGARHPRPRARVSRGDLEEGVRRGDRRGTEPGRDRHRLLGRQRTAPRRGRRRHPHRHRELPADHRRPGVPRPLRMPRRSRDRRRALGDLRGHRPQRRRRGEGADTAGQGRPPAQRLRGSPRVGPRRRRAEAWCGQAGRVGRDRASRRRVRAEGHDRGHPGSRPGNVRRRLRVADPHLHVPLRPEATARDAVHARARDAVAGRCAAGHDTQRHRGLPHGRRERGARRRAAARVPPARACRDRVAGARQRPGQGRLPRRHAVAASSASTSGTGSPRP